MFFHKVFANECFIWSFYMGLASTVAWATLTPEELWKLIADDTEKQFGFELKWLVCMCNVLGLIVSIGSALYVK